MNVVMTDKMDFVELQGSGEENVFSAAQLDEMSQVARVGISQLLQIQASALA
jgi:ribonuclease PH